MSNSWADIFFSFLFMNFYVAKYGTIFRRHGAHEKPQWPNISANDPDPGLGSKGVDPVFLLFLQR